MSANCAEGRRVMGTSSTIIVHGGRAPSPDMLFAELDRLECCWSRFLPGSELNRLNAASGHPVVVSPELFTLVRHQVAAYRHTGGRCDPSLRDRMVALGYDRTYRELGDIETAGSTPRFAPTVGAGAIELLERASAVILPIGVALDPGAIGKGLAADLVAQLAMEQGSSGVLVEIGGDIVTRGDAPDGEPWRIAVPATSTDPERILEVHDGAVATSDTSARSWLVAGELRNHILDPATGMPIERGLRATVVAGAGWWAEALATAAIVSTARGDGWIDEQRSIDASTDPSVPIVLVSETEYVDA